MLIVLVGLPGSGKTTAAASLARAIDWKHLDIDAEIERRAGKSIPRIFAEDGERRFRELEVKASRDLVGLTRTVVAAGGGWMSNEAARALLRPLARIIYLRLTPNTAFNRLGGASSGRPLLLGTDPLARLDALYRDRRVDYESADAVVDVETLDPQQVTKELVAIAAKLHIIR